MGMAMGMAMATGLMMFGDGGGGGSGNGDGVLSEEGFWENILLGEVGIRLRDLDLAQEKMGWFALGSRGHGTL